MDVKINADFKVAKDLIYSASISIPNTLSCGTPLLFFVKQKNNDDEKNTDTLVKVAVADEKHVLVSVAPPTGLMKAAKIDEIVKHLDVVVAEGEYDEEKCIFIERNAVENKS